LLDLDGMEGVRVLGVAERAFGVRREAVFDAKAADIPSMILQEPIWAVLESLSM
jgi:hypothetical protein